MQVFTNFTVGEEGVFFLRYIFKGPLRSFTWRFGGKRDLSIQTPDKSADKISGPHFFYKTYFCINGFILTV